MSHLDYSSNPVTFLLASDLPSYRQFSTRQTDSFENKSHSSVSVHTSQNKYQYPYHDIFISQEPGRKIDSKIKLVIERSSNYLPQHPNPLSPLQLFVSFPPLYLLHIIILRIYDSILRYLIFSYIYC